MITIIVAAIGEDVRITAIVTETGIAPAGMVVVPAAMAAHVPISVRAATNRDNVTNR